MSHLSKLNRRDFKRNKLRINSFLERYKYRRSSNSRQSLLINTWKRNNLSKK